MNHRVRVVIVDDEDWIRSLLKNMVDWRRLCMEIVGEAASGKRAREICIAQEADILMTDIKMPELDGLALIADLRVIMPNLVSIVISGYGEFEYARQAVREGVLDYVLKPLKKNQIESVLMRASSLITERKRRENDIKVEWRRVRKIVAEIVDDPGEADGSIDLRVQRACRLLSERCHENPTLGEIADKVFLNRTYFSELFKREIGVGFTHYVTDLKMDTAQKLLERTNLSVSEIARATGYCDVAYFCRVFRRKTSMTPGDFRARLRESNAE
ncbi:MAG: response regulator [Spirochaetaceae bacterium]|nr:MAG: response regulator [Spirochaetaceae bacterium]